METRDVSDRTIDEELARISSSFCPLRWSYMQADVSRGKVKACCKTPFVHIDSGWIEREGTSAIFNNSDFQDRRRGMLQGEKHRDCAACWQNESVGILSYRRQQSALTIFRNEISSISMRRNVDKAFPVQLELIANTTCNLKCSYCGPEFSSAWAAELKIKGPFPGETAWVDEPVATNFDGAFWSWMDEALPHLEYLQFNGGEPFLQDEVYSILERIVSSSRANKNLHIGVISSLGLPKIKMNRLLKTLPTIVAKHNLRFGVSQDSVGERAEYIRSGLNWRQFDSNLQVLLETFPNLEIQLAPTMSALNVTSILDLLKYSHGLIRAHGERIVMRPSIVNWPSFQAPTLLPKSYSSYLAEAVNYLEKKSLWPNMASWLREIEFAITNHVDSDERNALRAKFFQWFSEFDLRRKRSFMETFPEMEAFWRVCEDVASAQDGNPKIRG